jgi:hypothetical protein
MGEELEYKQFKVMQAIAIERICRNKVYWDSEDLFSRIKKSGLEDASVLLRVFIKLLNDHNSKLDADESRVRNLNYKSKNVYSSKYFHGINFRKVDEALKQNPDGDIWEIVRGFV